MYVHSCSSEVAVKISFLQVVLVEKSIHQWHCCGRRGRPACFSKFTAISFSGQVFRIVSTCLGSPPETFCWEFRDKEKNYHKHGPVTPVQFYNEHVKPYFNMEDKVGDAERQ